MIFFPLNGPYFPVSLHVFFFFLIKSWTFESNNVVTLEIGFSPFPSIYYSRSSSCCCCCCRLSVCQGSTWGMSLGSLQFYSEPAYPLSMCSNFLIFPAYAVVFELGVLVFNVWLPKEGKGENWRCRWGIRRPAFKSPRILISWRRRACNKWRKCNHNSSQPLCLHLRDQQQQPAVRAQISTIWRTESFLPTPAPTSCAGGSRNTGTAACHQSGSVCMGVRDLQLY